MTTTQERDIVDRIRLLRGASETEFVNFMGVRLALTEIYATLGDARDELERLRQELLDTLHNDERHVIERDEALDELGRLRKVADAARTPCGCALDGNAERRDHHFIGCPINKALAQLAFPNGEGRTLYPTSDKRMWTDFDHHIKQPPDMSTDDRDLGRRRMQTACDRVVGTWHYEQQPFCHQTGCTPNARSDDR